MLHNCGCILIHQASKAAGLWAQREVIIPELRTPKMQKPRVDVEAWGHPGLARLLVDFTVVSPDAQRYEGPQSTPAQAARRGEQGEVAKYNAGHGGTKVTGASMETTVAGYARAIDSQMGHPPRRLLSQWRLQLSMALARFTAAAVLSARDPEPTSGTRGSTSGPFPTCSSAAA